MPFNRSTIVPMFVTGPGIKAGSANHLLAHIDLVPTFLELAQGKATATLDGKSFAPLLVDRESVSPEDFRAGLLIQNWEEKGQVGQYLHSSYASLRTSDQIYTEWPMEPKSFTIFPRIRINWKTVLKLLMWIKKSNCQTTP